MSALLKVPLALALALAPTQAIPQTEPEAQPIAPRVVCLQAGGYSAGTAFRIGPHLLLSVKHVTSAGNCQIEGQAIHILYTSPKADFSILTDERPTTEFLKVDCDGFKEGRRYLAIGHARALDQLTIVPMVGTGQYAFGMAVLAGIFTAQPGQSGGPIIDAETGKVVGTVNTGNWEQGLTGSVELKGTPVCHGTDA